MSEVRYIATAGMFDGVHRGHQFVLRSLADEARKRGLEPVVFTFEPHPLALVAPDKAPQLLTSPARREELIKSLTGVQRVETIEATAEFLARDARSFLGEIHGRCGVDVFLMGFNNHIGSDRAAATDLAEAPVEVRELLPFPDGRDVSSSAVRRAIAASDFGRAESLMGHRWVYDGVVVHGHQLGRTIGFPTANIEPAVPGLLLPPAGVYAVDVRLPDGREHRGMANIGTRPTVSGHGTTFEVNIFGFEGNLYGRAVEVRFLKRLRAERPFGSLEELKAQLEADRRQAKAVACK